MCGFLFVSQKKPIIDKFNFKKLLAKFSWRGPDYSSTCSFKNNNVLIGHNRLSIIDLSSSANQPFSSKCGRFYIVFNGEIYNFKNLKKDLDLNCTTNSDTEIILLGYIKLGKKILDYLDGMYAFVIYDNLKNSWFSARDHFGIKPIYYFHSSAIDVICSEPSIISSIVNASVDENSIEEWKFLRKPVPGYSFFKNVFELPPGTYQDSNQKINKYWKLSKEDKKPFCQDEFTSLLRDSVKSHQVSDVEIVSFLSSGMDSSTIALYANKIKQTYSIGLNENNEFDGVSKIAYHLKKDNKDIFINENQLIDTWKFLTKLKGEPLSLPNEALIYLCAKSMNNYQKVILTGEGADELLFGYDRIFRWASKIKKLNLSEFLSRYAYSKKFNITDRFINFCENIDLTIKPINFVEDFFIQFHLPGLLRRMDFATMAASKEARVPFVNKKLFEYMYRREVEIKIDSTSHKIPLKKILKINKVPVNFENKIPFNAKLNLNLDKFEEYSGFQKLVLKELNWIDCR